MSETKRRPGRPATGTNPVRSFRMGDVYDQAEAKAEAHDEKLKDVIERLLAVYVAEV